MIMYLVWSCSVGNNSNNIVYITIFAYLALLQIIGIILAIQTRKVEIKVLNDAKYIAALIYISSIAWLTLLVVAFVLPNGMINVTELFFSGGLLVPTTAFLCLTFIPKVYIVMRQSSWVLYGVLHTYVHLHV